MPVNFSKYRNRISIQSLVESAPDDYNQTTKTPTTVATRWAQITPLSGRSLEIARAVHQQVTHEVKLRYYEGLGPDHKFLFGTRTFEIKSVKNVDEKNEEMIALCVEEV